jgi:hypothetical protein
MERKGGASTLQSRPDKAPKCPRCGCEIPLEKYRQAIELGIDGVRDVCPVCGSILLISFEERTATEAP